MHGLCKKDFWLLVCFTSCLTKCCLSVDVAFFSEGYYKNNATDYGYWFNKRSIQNILEPRLDLRESRKVWPDAPEWAPYMKEPRMRRWYDLIANFSSRAITFPSDRLPALAGLARIFAHPSLGLYLAGLWADDLYTGLSWTTTFPDSTAIPHSYFAPSWSWLSANAACSWDGRLWASAKRGSSRQQTEEHSHWKKNYGPKLLSTHIQSVPGDTFTSVKEGSYIELEGYCRSLLIRYKPPTKTAAGPNGVVLKTVHLDKSVSGDISFYFENTPESSREVILLQICKSGGYDLSVHALLLEGSKEAGYRRIGTARLENYNLCGFLTTKSHFGLQWVAHRHPREVDGRKSDMENREWQLDRWERRKIKIF